MNASDFRIDEPRPIGSGDDAPVRQTLHNEARRRDEALDTFTYWTTGPTVSVDWRLANTTPFTADTCDLTAALVPHVQATWGTSSGSNNLTCHQFFGEVIY